MHKALSSIPNSEKKKKERKKERKLPEVSTENSRRWNEVQAQATALWEGRLAL
jgi:hypothetical protein